MHRLIIIRHGESTWNRRTASPAGPMWIFIRRVWVKARRRARSGAKVTSSTWPTRRCSSGPSTRSGSSWMSGPAWVPVDRTWRLNERHYGALQGLNKAEMAAKFGEAQVMVWRRGYACRRPHWIPPTRAFPATIRATEPDRSGTAAH